MNRRAILLAATFGIALLIAQPGRVQAADGSNGGVDGGTAGASTGSGTVTVGSGSGSGSTTRPVGSGTASGGNSGAVCRYSPLAPSNSQILGIGGPTPGQWIEPYCTGAGYINPMAPMWVTTGQTPQQAMPVIVAQQALEEMSLPAPVISTSPATSSDQIVHVPTWLWIDGGIWKAQSVTATAGGVTATATATPADVLWSMGDGQEVVCTGPGTPYDTSRPASAQSTNCSYTWATSSAGQPSSSFTVTATVQWRVTWTVTGAAGGGSLGVVNSPTSTVAVRVAEVEAINQTPN